MNYIVAGMVHAGVDPSHVVNFLSVKQINTTRSLSIVLLQYGRPEGLDGNIHVQCTNNSGIYSYTYSSYIIHKRYANFAQ